MWGKLDRVKEGHNNQVREEVKGMVHMGLVVIETGMNQVMEVGILQGKTDRIHRGIRGIMIRDNSRASLL